MCGQTVYCRLLPDTDTGTDTDSQTSSDTSTVSECQTGNTTIEWLPNPTSDYDCGPGCKQLSFEELNPVTGWSAKGRYVGYTQFGTSEPRVVDVESNCFAVIVHPEFGQDASFMYPDVNGDRVGYSVMNYSPSISREFLTVALDTGEMERCLQASSPADSIYHYRNTNLDFGIIAFLEVKSSNSQGQAMLFDIPTSTLTEMSAPNLSLWDLRLSTDIAVWTDKAGGGGDIYAHRISTGETWNLTDHPDGQFSPRIDGTRVVWTDLRHGGGNWDSQITWDHADIFMYDFATDELTSITNQDWLQLYPDIEGDRIVWQDSRACEEPNNPFDWSDIDIWMYDLSTGQQHQITNLPGPEGDPQISGDRVFFMAYSPDGYPAIFVQDLAALGL
jgi:beta propeller repeat protein